MTSSTPAAPLPPVPRLAAVSERQADKIIVHRNAARSTSRLTDLLPAEPRPA